MSTDAIVESPFADALSNRYVGKFYGPEQITGIYITDQKTPSGECIFCISTTGDKERTVTERALVAVASDEAKDYNHIRDARMAILIPKMIDLVEEYDLSMGEIEYMAKSLGQQIGARFDRASNFLWTKSDKGYVAGYDSMYDVSLNMAERVISGIPHEEPK